MARAIDWQNDLLGMTEFDEDAVVVELEQKLEEVEAYAATLREALPIYDKLAECLDWQEIEDVGTEAKARVRQCERAAELLAEAGKLIDQALEERGEAVEAWAEAGDGVPDNVPAVILKKPAVKALVAITDRLVELEDKLTDSHDWLLADIVALEGSGVYIELESAVPDEDLTDISEALLGFIAFLADPSNNFALIEERMDELGDEEEDEEP